MKYYLIVEQTTKRIMWTMPAHYKDNYNVMSYYWSWVQKNLFENNTLKPGYIELYLDINIDNFHYQDYKVNDDFDGIIFDEFYSSNRRNETYFYTKITELSSSTTDFIQYFASDSYIPINSVVSIKTDGKIELSSSNNINSKSVIGITLDEFNGDGTTEFRVQTDGIVEMTGLTIGENYLLSITSGEMTTLYSEVGTYVVLIGKALTNEKFLIDKEFVAERI